MEMKDRSMVVAGDLRALNEYLELLQMTLILINILKYSLVNFVKNVRDGRCVFHLSTLQVANMYWRRMVLTRRLTYRIYMIDISQ